jgi:hypothetical protein
MPVLHFSADHPALRTGVGELSSGVIRVQTGYGCGLYGPYIDLPAGPCVARIKFTGPARGRAQMDLCSDWGTTVIASREIDFDGGDGQEIEVSTILPQPRSGCEVRLFSGPELVAAISAVEFVVDDFANVEQVLRSELCNDPARPNSGIRNGRDVRAGYARGTGLEFRHLRPFIDSDPDWIAACKAARGRSIVAVEKLMNLFLIVKYSSIVAGNIIEYGSFRGGSALLLACLAKRLRRSCKVFALDTYGGMPETDGILDRHRAGSFADVDLAGFERAREAEGLDNLLILKGLFHDTVETIAPADRCFFLSHVDCDVYESAVFSIEFSKQHAVKGSYIVLDDPQTSDCLGAMQATEECLIQQGLFAEQVYPHLVYRYPALESSV